MYVDTRDIACTKKLLNIIIHFVWQPHFVPHLMCTWLIHGRLHFQYKLGWYEGHDKNLLDFFIWCFSRLSMVPYLCRTLKVYNVLHKILNATWFPITLGLWRMNSMFLKKCNVKNKKSLIFLSECIHVVGKDTTTKRFEFVFLFKTFDLLCSWFLIYFEIFFILSNINENFSNIFIHAHSFSA